MALASLAAVFSPTLRGQPITNLQQLSAALNSNPRIERAVAIDATVCAASRPKVGVLILQDESGVELLQLGNFGRELRPGERIRLSRAPCLLRKREMGIQISAPPVVNNDGLHAATSVPGSAHLRAGKIPLRVEWFNYWRTMTLGVSWSVSNRPPQSIPASRLWHAVVTDAGETNFMPGLQAECFEGSWESVPDFNLLQPVKTSVVPDFSLGLRSRDERVGVRYSGFLEVPGDGQYHFSLLSDDGALLFLGDPDVPIVSIGRTEVPHPTKAAPLETGRGDLEGRSWTVVEGRVSFVSPMGEGVKFDLGTDRHVISVGVADVDGLDLSVLLNSRVRITGIRRAVLTLDRTAVFGKLFAASAKDVVFLEPALGAGAPKLPLTSVDQVQGLPIEKARQGLPVRIRGTVTGAMKTSQESWMSFQDDTRGIFVRLTALSDAAPAFGELWEVEGHSGAGDFAPIVIADKATRLGEGLLPPPVKPTWTELLNGSRDVQWAELKGLVTDVQSNTISLHLPEGQFNVELDGWFASELTPFLKSVIRIRGVLYALWDADTREVRVGKVMMRNAAISRDVPAPADPFDAVLKTPRELLLFDAQATAFRPVKLQGQIIYADSTQMFLEQDGAGVRLLPAGKTNVRPGDLVDAVGYPDIGRAELVLREAVLRKTGDAPLPPPKTPGETNLSHEDLNSTRVLVEGKLLGWHAEQGRPVLEMQAGTRLFLARFAAGESSARSLRPGSRLALVGVFVGRTGNQRTSTENESFELLLNSAADITLLSKPSWWTLPRLLALTGVLLVILIITVVWNTQLRRLVEQRTDQLQRENRERERIERQHALEAERSRIARDLHDDLGSSLTEISVLASHRPAPSKRRGRPARSVPGHWR